MIWSALILAAAAALAATGLEDVYVLGDSYKVNREGTRIWSLGELDLGALKKRSRIWDSAARRVSLAGARRETVAFQLFLQAGAGGARDVDVRVSGLEGEGASIDPTAVELFKVWYTQTTRTSNVPNCAPSTGVGWYPDALVPWEVGDHGEYDGPPFAIEAGTAQSVWVDVHIPAGVPAGGYAGKISVLEGGRETAAVDLHLRVRDFELPRRGHHLLFMNANASDIWQAGGDDVADRPEFKAAFEEAMFVMGRAHRFTIGNMYYEGNHDRSSNLPGITTDAEGNITDVDWTKYDERWGKYLSPRENCFGAGEPPIEIWRLPMGTGFSKRRFPEGERAFEQFPRWIKKHWEEKGWDLESAYVYLADEPKIEQLAALAALAREVAAAIEPPLHMQIAVLAQREPERIAAEYSRQFGGLLDRWLWSANSIDSARLRRDLRPTDWVGFYQGNEPYCPVHVLDKDGLALRTWSWIAWRYSVDYSCYFSITECSIGIREEGESFRFKVGGSDIWKYPTNRPNGNQSKAVCFYPGAFVGYEMPIANIRMKQVRRGQQDYEYMWLAARKCGRDKIDADVGGIVKAALEDAAEAPNLIGSKAGDWDTNPEHWDELVARWGDAIEK